MTAERAVMSVKKVTYLGEFGHVNNSCIRKNIILMLLSSSGDKAVHAFVAILTDRCICWFPAAMLEPIRMGSSIASL